MERAQGFFVDSYHLYQIAIDGYYKSSKGFDIHRQNDALVSIVFSALALEAFINELSSLAKDAKQAGSTEAFLDKLIDSIHESKSTKKSTCEKFMLASVALGDGFKKGENPYQDFADLFRLRDCLVHLKPEDRIETEENGEIKYLGRELAESLRNKGIFQKYTQLKSITLLISTARAAMWACKTASTMVNAILDKIPQSDFTNNNKALNLYKSEFQPPTAPVAVVESVNENLVTKEYNSEEAKEEFTSLASQWTQDVEGMSSTIEMVKHPAYQKIVRMGQVVVPFLLEDLRQNPLYWLPALRQITQQNPVQPEHRGKIKQMAKAWLNWGKQEGYIV